MAAANSSAEPVRIVYFSNVSEYTKRFVDKLGFSALRLPVRAKEVTPVVEEPYVLIVPTYGGCKEITGGNAASVPRPVVTFLNNPHNRSLLRGVIASGNSNFGHTFGVAGDIIARKTGVPYLYRFELMGTHEDVELVREGLEKFWQHQ